MGFGRSVTFCSLNELKERIIQNGGSHESIIREIEESATRCPVSNLGDFRRWAGNATCTDCLQKPGVEGLRKPPVSLPGILLEPEYRHFR